MKSTKVSFKNRSNIKISGYLDLPNNKNPRHIGVFAHCFTCHKQYKVIVNINRVLTGNGWGILRFDFTGLGESGGNFADTTFSTNVSDLIDAVMYLKEEYKIPELLIGHSLGGLASIKAATELSFIKAVSTIGTPCDLTGLLDRVKNREAEFKSHGQAMLNVGGRDFLLKEEFVTDIYNHNISEDIKNLKAPILIFHAPKDDVVSFKQGLQLFESISSHKNFITLSEADHLVLNNDHALYIGRLLAEWTNQYV